MKSLPAAHGDRFFCSCATAILPCKCWPKRGLRFSDKFFCRASKPFSEREGELFLDITYRSVVGGTRDVTRTIRRAALCGGTQSGFTKWDADDEHAVV